MSEDLAKALIVALFSTGGATFIWTLVKSYIAWRDSAELREDKAIARLEEFERRCREELECEREWSQHWRMWAGKLEYAMEQRGHPLPERPSPPARPSDINSLLDK